MIQEYKIIPIHIKYITIHHRRFFIQNTVAAQINPPFMLYAPHAMFIAAQVMSFCEWLSIIARCELGSDLDCSVINYRSELGSDLDCYELSDIVIR